MAVETVEIRLDESWKLISTDNAAVVSWQVTSFQDALFYISDTAPTAGSFVGQMTRQMPPTVFGSAKVYARAVRDTAKVSIQRTVNAGNAGASPILQALILSAAALQTNTPSGTVVGTLQNRLAGSTTTLLSSRRRLALSSDGASLLVGLQPAAPGKFTATVREEHPDAGIRDTTLELTVTAPALTLSGTPPAAVEGQDYFWQPVVSGGYGTRAFRIAGSLPTGWSVSSTTGAIFAPGAFVRASLSPVALGTLTVADDTGSSPLALGTVTVNAGGGFFIPPALGFNTTLFPVVPTLDPDPTPTQFTRRTGSAGLAPEAVFDSWTDVRTTPEVMYWVALTGGSDSNAGTVGAPLNSVKGAIDKANAAGKKLFIAMPSGELPRGQGPAGAVPLNDIAIVSTGTTVTGTFDSGFTFASDAAGGTNGYSATLATLDRVSDRLTFDSSGDPVDLVRYANLAALVAATINSGTQGGYALDSGKVYIRRADGAQPTYSNIRLYRPGVDLWAWTTAVNVYMEGIVAEGGNLASFKYQMSAVASSTKVFVAKNCHAKKAGGDVQPGGRGFSIDGLKGLAYLFGCSGRTAATDGINFHDAIGAGTQALLVNCDGVNNGKSPGQSCNGLTGHEAVPLIDIAGRYEMNHGGTVRSVNTSKGLFLGTLMKDDLGDAVFGGPSAPVAVQTDNSAEFWLDSCKISMPATQRAITAGTGTAVHLRSTMISPGATTNSGGGTVDTY